MNTPFVSIIVPTYDRPNALKTCMQALQNLDYPRDRFEIIVVDDGSLVPVEVTKKGESDLVNISCLRQPNTGPASARNAGAKHARGEVLAFTDDDCVPGSQWLRELAHSYGQAPDGLIGGRTVNALVDNPYSTASQLIVDEAYRFFHSRKSALSFFATNNMAVSAAFFHELGGFDATFRTSEDRDFCDRWMRQSHPLVFAEKAIVHHYHDLTWKTFCHQHFGYGRGARRFHRARARRGGTWSLSDLWFYPSLCRRALLSPPSGKAFSMAPLMVLCQTANLAGYVWEGVRPSPL